MEEKSVHQINFVEIFLMEFFDTCLKILHMEDSIWAEKHYVHGMQWKEVQ